MHPISERFPALLNSTHFSHIFHETFGISYEVGSIIGTQWPYLLKLIQPSHLWDYLIRYSRVIRYSNILKFPNRITFMFYEFQLKISPATSNTYDMRK